jgi:hypothetical protein
MPEHPPKSPERGSETRKLFVEKVREHFEYLDTRPLDTEESSWFEELIETHLARKRSQNELSTFDVALTMDWATKSGALDRWRQEPKKNLKSCHREFQKAAAEYVDHITGLVYTTKNGLFTLEHLHYHGSVQEAGAALNVCVKNLSGIGFRYAPLLEIPEGEPESELTGKRRAPLELFVLRLCPRKSDQSPAQETTYLPPPRGQPVLLISYAPGSSTIPEVEMRGAHNGMPIFLKHDSHLLAPFLEVVRAMRSGEIPDSYVGLCGGLQAVCKPGHVLYDTGEQVPFLDADPNRAIAGGIVSVSPTDRRFSPTQLAIIGRLFPMLLDMTLASAEQRAALTEVRGSLRDSNRESVAYPRLREVGIALTTSACQFSAPALKRIGLEFHIEGNRAVMDVPQLDDFFVLFRRNNTQVRCALSPSVLDKKTRLL